MNKFLKKTKIVATCGPAARDYETIKKLIKAGANMFRLNTSHESLEIHAEQIKTIRAVSKEMGVFVPILVDLQGPKIRIGTLKEPIELKEDDVIYLAPIGVTDDENVIPVDYKGISNDVSSGDIVMIDDGKLQIQVITVKNKIIQAKVINGGLLKSRKGINIPGTTASLSAVTERDVECIKFAVENDADYLALSFVREESDVLLARKYLSEFGASMPIIAKIEKPQAVDNLESIVKASEGIMVARGDLGIEISPEKVPIVQKEIIATAIKYRKTVIVATQMLETMIEQPIPTRAEASDVANAIIDGADAIMLSGETSVGKYAVEAVSMMTSIAQNVENAKFCSCNLNLPVSDFYELTPQSIVASAVKLANDVQAKAILAFTHTGYSTKLLSKQRPSTPILAISDLDSTCRKLSLLWGTVCFKKDWDTVFCRELLQKIDEFLLAETFLKLDDRVIITGSIPKLISGRTNFLRVHRIGATSTKDL